MAILGRVLTELDRWDPKTWQRKFKLTELPNQLYRVKVNSAIPVNKSNIVEIVRTTSYVRNQIQQGIRMKNKFEVVHKTSKIPFNADIPDNLPLDDMGIGGWTNREDYVWPEIDPVTRYYRKTPWLDHQSMNNIDFRQRCITANGRLYVLQPMGRPEIAGPKHLQPENLINWLKNPCRCKTCRHKNSEIEFIDAQSIVKVLFNLQMDRARVIKLVFGYQPSIGGKGAWKHGVKSLEPEIIGDLAYDFEQLEAKLPKLLPEGQNETRTLDDERAYYLDVSNTMLENGQNYLKELNLDLTRPLQQMRYIEHMANLWHNAFDHQPDQNKIDFLIEKGFGVEEQSDQDDDGVYENSDFAPVGDGWTAMPLSDGNDTVDWHWIACIKTAGVKRLQAWKRLMYQISERLTRAQIQDLWDRIWQRQAILIESIKPKITLDVQMILDEIPHLTSNQAKALIFAYDQGGAFERYTSFDFQNPGDPELVFYLWNAYRELVKD
jgi:hypothetical protein